MPNNYFQIGVSAKFEFGRANRWPSFPSILTVPTLTQRETGKPHSTLEREFRSSVLGFSVLLLLRKGKIKILNALACDIERIVQDFVVCVGLYLRRLTEKPRQPTGAAAEASLAGGRNSATTVN